MLDGHIIPLGSKSSEILRLLLEARGGLVTKDEIVASVWPGMAVEENVVQVHMSALRRALGEIAPCLVTVRGSGYRLDLDGAVRNVPRNSIAVLPFANLTGEPALDKLAEGLTEELVGTLSKDTCLVISARTASTPYSRRATDVRTIGHELGVATVLEGSIRVSERELRITAELVDAATGFQLWAECYEAEMGDVLKLEASLATSIRQAIKLQFGAGGAPSGTATPRAD